MLGRVGSAVRALPADPPDEQAPRAAFHAYLALSGASTGLVRSVVRAGETDALPGLEETILSLHLAVLAARPRTA
jgi:hypothetical protein